jgi:hypothetical protein
LKPLFPESFEFTPQRAFRSEATKVGVWLELSCLVQESGSKIPDTVPVWVFEMMGSGGWPMRRGVAMVKAPMLFLMEVERELNGPVDGNGGF